MQSPPPLRWPGVAGSAPAIRNFGKNSYVGLHFHTPDDAGTLSGYFVRPAYWSGPSLTIAISGSCGDFSQDLPTPGCLASDVAVKESVAHWFFQSGNPGPFCALQPGSDYYVNIMLTHPQDANSNEIPVGVTSMH